MSSAKSGSREYVQSGFTKGLSPSRPVTISPSIQADLDAIMCSIKPGDVYSISMEHGEREHTVIEGYQDNNGQDVYLKPSSRLHEVGGKIKRRVRELRCEATLVRKGDRSFLPVSEERLAVEVCDGGDIHVYSCTREVRIGQINDHGDRERELCHAQLWARGPKMRQALDLCPAPLKAGFSLEEATSWMEVFCAWNIIKDGLIRIDPPFIHGNPAT